MNFLKLQVVFLRQETHSLLSKDNVSRWTFLRPVGKDGLDSGLDWTGLGGNFVLGGEVVLLF